MRQRARQLALVSLPLALTLAATCASSARAVEFTPCPEHFGYSCATVVVPLDRSGVVPGTISLRVERKQAGVAPSKDAVIALSGGPGQAALPSITDIAKSMSPALNNRDLVVFDQRGTGQSGPLNCPALSSEQAAARASSIGQLFEQCALQIGPARAFYTTRDSAEDIESIRQALGYEKLVLRGVSYGTKVALAYAERYPGHVESLLLDSVVAPDGPEPFDIPTFQAIAPVLSELCSAGACAHVTASPLKDIAQLASELRTHPLSGSVYDGSGQRHASSFSELDLMSVLEDGDLNPALRALLPAAVHSALNHDPQPLLRLNLLANGFIPTLPGTAQPTPEAEQEGNALYFATRCEEGLFPWVRSDPPAARKTEATAALRALPSADFYPFDAELALSHSLLPECVGWPDASTPPAPGGALPNVPTLILSGEQDLRTPTSVARRVAAEIPDAELLTVPYTGHSVLGTDFSGCAQAAVVAFFASHPVVPCAAGADIFAPTPVTPRKLAYVPSTPGVAGRDGRTVTAVLDTIVDVDRQLIGATLQANAKLPSGASFGGLRGGYARIHGSTMRLSRYSLLPGVELSGTFPLHADKLAGATVRIEGAAAATGTVTLGGGGKVTGTLAGKRFSASLKRATLARLSGVGTGWSGADWSAAAMGLPFPGLYDRR